MVAGRRQLALDVREDRGVNIGEGGLRQGLVEIPLESHSRVNLRTKHDDDRLAFFSDGVTLTPTTPQDPADHHDALTDPFDELAQVPAPAEHQEHGERNDLEDAADDNRKHSG